MYLVREWPKRPNRPRTLHPEILTEGAAQDLGVASNEIIVVRGEPAILIRGSGLRCGSARCWSRGLSGGFAR